MKEKQKPKIDPAAGAGDPIGEAGDSLANKKAALDDLLASADNAIEGAMTQNADNYLEMRRQQGGQ